MALGRELLQACHRLLMVNMLDLHARQFAKLALQRRRMTRTPTNFHRLSHPRRTATNLISDVGI